MGLSHSPGDRAGLTGVEPSARRRERVFRQLAQDAALVQVVREFQDRQIEYRLLKGAAFARWLYDDPAQRTYRDIDLLVPPEGFSSSAAALADLGFRPDAVGRDANERVDHHDGWLRDTAIPVRVELHRTVFFVDVPPAQAWKCLSAGPATIVVAGTDVAVPAEPACAVVVALHAAQHGTGERRPLEDLARALDRVAVETWHRAAELARELRAQEAFATGLRLTSGGREIAQQLELPLPVSRTVRLRSATAPSTAIGIERFTTTTGPRAKLRLLWSELVPSPTFMRRWQPLARRGRLGLAAAYLWRPLWLLAKLPRGWRAWRRAAAPDRHGKS